MLTIIGLGNELRGDDGIGPAVLKELQRRTIPTPVDLVDAGSDAFVLLDRLITGEPVIVIDCAQMGKQPGDFSKFSPGEIQPSWLMNSISLHGFSTGEMLQMAGQLGRQPADCLIIGIEPKSIAFNAGLSEEVGSKIPVIIDTVLEEIYKYAKKSFNH